MFRFDTSKSILRIPIGEWALLVVDVVAGHHGHGGGTQGGSHVHTHTQLVVVPVTVRRHVHDGTPIVYVLRHQSETAGNIGGSTDMSAELLGHSRDGWQRLQRRESGVVIGAGTVARTHPTVQCMVGHIAHLRAELSRVDHAADTNWDGFRTGYSGLKILVARARVIRLRRRLWPLTGCGARRIADLLIGRELAHVFHRHSYNQQRSNNKE